MFRMPAFFCLFLLTALAVKAQRSLSGMVIDGITKQPLVGSSVFISNTAFGTVTARDGSFELKDIPPGNYDLIISSVGFETNVYSFNSEKLPLRLRVELERKIKELDNVTVEPGEEQGWEQWGRLFMDNFVGQTSNAKSCRIVNKDAIRFQYYKKSNRLIAYCDEQIILENRALGYIIRYQLEDFEINFKTHATLFVGYPLFEEINKKQKGVPRRWQRSRDKAYYGSMMHFMRAVYNNTIASEGYEVRRMVRKPNLEKERVRAIYRGRISSQRENMSIRISSGNSTVPVIKSDATLADSSDYYERILSQGDNIDTYSQHLLTADSIIVQQDGVFKIMFFQDYLYVTYKNAIEEQDYLEYHNERRQRTFQRSYICLQNEKAIAIDHNGSYYPPQEIFSMAYWGWNEKMASLLPLDYQPFAPVETKLK